MTRHKKIKKNQLSKLIKNLPNLVAIKEKNQLDQLIIKPDNFNGRQKKKID